MIIGHLRYAWLYLTNHTNNLPGMCNNLKETITQTLYKLTASIDKNYIPKKSLDMGIDEKYKGLLSINHPLFERVKWFNKKETK